jgi:alpha-beta hydrolase superfamily lysophospholipase
MRVISSTTSNGVSERVFTIDDLPCVLWTPATNSTHHPLILLAHGGGQHKLAPHLVDRAHHYVTRGFAVAALDAPAHGERPKTGADQRFGADLRSRMTAGEPVADHIARYNAELSARAVPEWRLLLDALADLDGAGPGRPIGFWGVSLGAAIGVPLIAAESRITAAVLGLVGDRGLAATAARISVPVQFLLQWDDELVPRDAGLALFDALGSPAKTLHANPGGHRQVPAFELESSAEFLARHLLRVTGSPPSAGPA